MSRQILLYDNEVVIHQLLMDYLGHLGFQVIIASNQAECESCLQKFIPDVMLIDTELPHNGTLRGIQALRALGLKTPVLLMSAHSDISSQEDLFRMGASGLIEKPFHVKQMLKRIDQLASEVAPPG